ncbi:MAG: universal stress protein, partial [Candidatus Krumholzibacteria bacterium]
MNYRDIYVGIDGSELSNAAAQYAISIGRADDAKLHGSHVYAAKLHERRFKMMEGGLPEEYREENALEHQRNIHDSLITQGLELITDSYLCAMEQSCRESGIPFCGVSLEGKNWRELAKDINAKDYDLIVLGGHGVGRVAVSQLGTVTERLLRRVRRDVFICNKSMEENGSDEVVVCLDGSSRSWGALKRGLALAKSFQKKMIAISCFDPYFHYAMFSAINRVITDKAREVFKFEEQEKLHEDIIDSGLAKIYQSHLDVAKRIGGAEGLEISTQLLDGKAYAKILEFIGQRSPWLVLMGRIGIHSDEDMDIGGNTENVCRLAECNVLVVETKYSPPQEYLAEATVTWTKEASGKMNLVP